MNRKTFLRRATVATALPLTGLSLSAQTRDRPPPLNPDRVFEFVRVSHFNADRVAALLAEEPKLVYASWDWGGGDWETGLGAASHVGRRDIAETQLQAGARMDIFAAAMLGQSAVVRAMIEADPLLAEQVGPHGYRVLYHVAISGDVDLAVAVLASVKDAQFHLDQALPAAVRDGHYAMTAWLLESGAGGVNTPNGRGETPLAVARASGDERLVALLKRHGAK